MAVTPTRYMNRQTPIEMMTLDQFFVIKGETSIPRKKISRRPIGPPRPISELQAEDRIRELYGETSPAGYSDEAVRATIGDVASVDVTPHQPAVPVRSPGERPKARLVTPIAAPDRTDPNDARPLKIPCRDGIDLEIEIDGVGLALYPLVCESPEPHPGGPHLARVPGRDENHPGRRLDVFVGWDDALD